jgi:transposase-like protein
VKLSSLSGVLIQDVAAALDIHPFMLSLWRKQVRDGVIVAKGRNWMWKPRPSSSDCASSSGNTKF